MNSARRFEKGESYVEFRFDGNAVKMRNTETIGRVDMNRTAALDRIATLEATGWDEVDPC
jgi:hypothetical protein